MGLDSQKLKEVVQQLPVSFRLNQDFYLPIDTARRFPIHRKGDKFSLLGVAISVTGPYEYLIQFEDEAEPEYVRELPPHE